jgi:hypothetical protein
VLEKLIAGAFHCGFARAPDQLGFKAGFSSLKLHKARQNSRYAANFDPALFHCHESPWAAGLRWATTKSG